MFIMDNKRCDQIYRKNSVIPRVVPLVLGDMICATNYGENLCYVSWGGSRSSPSVGSNTQVGGWSPGRGPPASVLLPSLFPCDFDFPNILQRGPQLQS